VEKQKEIERKDSLRVKIRYEEEESVKERKSLHFL
jgi:hypothetical protein